MMIFTVNSSKEKPKLIINQRPAHTKIASAGPVTMDYLEYALPQLTVCRLPLPRCMIRAGGFFLAFFYFFLILRPWCVMCIYHNNCSNS
jgi:hypothetical protein